MPTIICSYNMALIHWVKFELKNYAKITIHQCKVSSSLGARDNKPSKLCILKTNYYNTRLTFHQIPMGFWYFLRSYLKCKYQHHGFVSHKIHSLGQHTCVSYINFVGFIHDNNVPKIIIKIIKICDCLL